MISKFISCSGNELAIYDEPVGIMVSGGVDSAILLYYLMKHSTSTIHIYTEGSNHKFRRNTIIAPQVVEKCIQLTDNINVIHHINYNKASTWNSLYDNPKSAVDSGLVKIVYEGVTMNPPDDIAKKFTPELESGIGRDGSIGVFHSDNKFYMPWANTDKRGIAQMYREENLMDSLFSVTRSCEYDPTCDYFDEIKDPQLGHCGECWWCKEREWGFKGNGE
jgi:7-cyano-7-deazaguanine synthase in queuosine biosynthesis